MKVCNCTLPNIDPKACENCNENQRFDEEFKAICDDTTIYKEGVYPAEPNKMSDISKISIESIFMHEFSHCRDYSDMQRIAGELIELVLQCQEQAEKLTKNRR